MAVWRVDRLGADDAVGVAVADDLEVDVVGVPAAGEHRVQLLAAFGAGRQPVHGVHRHALGGVHGGRVPEFGRRGDVVGGQHHAAATAGVEGADAAARGEAGDGPPVAVLHPIGRRDAEAAVVGAGDDHVPDRRGQPVGELDLAAGDGCR